MLIEDKHAYLIMAFNDVYCYSKLINLLDYEKNDIFVHIDKKADIMEFKSVKTHKAGLYFTDRISVDWGDYSQIAAELILMKNAKSHGPYRRYHLLSGVDLPLHSQKMIHEFFDSYPDKEFVGICSPKDIRENSIYRIGYRHICLHYYRSHNLILKCYSHFVHRCAIEIQRLFNIKRNLHELEISRGPQWFSITNDLLQYILENEDFIEHTFNHGFCVDELFIPTLVWNSRYRDKVFSCNQYESCDRLIDFKRGNPWVWRTEDFDTLVNSGKMFARKFSSKVDVNIINKIFDYVESE